MKIRHLLAAQVYETPCRMAEEFSFSRSGRQPATIAYTAFAVIVLLVLIFRLDAHPLIIAFFAVVVSPAIWDVIANNRAEFHISDESIRWQVGKRANDARLDEIDRVKARTAFDFSQRVSIRMCDGSRRAIPPPCIPPGRVLDSELKARGVRVERIIFI
jgi:hypothetical protein